MDLQKYYARVKSERAKLRETFPNTQFCFVISVDNLDKNTTAGQICEVPLDAAGLLIADSTHRLATPAEVEEYVSAQAILRRQIEVEQLNRARQSFNQIMGNPAAGVPGPISPPIKSGK